MAEKLTDIPSPADAKSYDSGLKGDSDPKPARSTADGISDSPASAKTFRTSWQSGSPASAVSPDNIALDRAKQHSVKPNLSDRR